MATTKVAGHSPGAWGAIVRKAFPGNSRIKAGRPEIIVSTDVPDCAAKVGTLCWDATNEDAYICTDATGAWVKINASHFDGLTCNLSLADGVAFITNPSKDLSPYTGCKITLTDSIGRKAVGYIRHNASDDPFVQMSYAASGSSGIAIADNDNIDFGTGNFTLFVDNALSDWTPGSSLYIVLKRSGTTGAFYGYTLMVSTTGYLVLIMYRNDAGTTYTSTAPISAPDGTFHRIGVAVTRENVSTAGSILFFEDGAQLGDAVAITAADPVTISNTGTLYINGTSSAHNASITKSLITYNRALTAAEVLALYQSGVAEADKWGSQTAVYTSDFSAGVDGWSGDRVTVAGNIDSIGGQDNTLRIYASADNNTHTAHRYPTAAVDKRYRVSFDYYLPSTNTNVKRLGIITAGSPSAPDYIYSTTDAWTAVTIESAALISAYNPRFCLGSVSAWSFVGANSVTDDLVYLKNVVITPIGATLALEPDGIGVTDWQDSSTNNLDASYPATGYSVYPDGTGVRITSTRGGTTYNWTSIEEGFNYNEISYDAIITRAFR